VPPRPPPQLHEGLVEAAQAPESNALVDQTLRPQLVCHRPVVGRHGITMATYEQQQVAPERERLDRNGVEASRLDEGPLHDAHEGARRPPQLLDGCHLAVDGAQQYRRSQA
jgi:hypothetical protein